MGVIALQFMGVIAYHRSKKLKVPTLDIDIKSSGLTTLHTKIIKDTLVITGLLLITFKVKITSKDDFYLALYRL